MKITPGDPAIAPENFWVFGYASLIWRPGFTFAEARTAVLPGFRRDMCFISVHYRGTVETPGLICGLMPEQGVACRGRAYRIAPENIAEAVRYLDERELITDIYHPRHLPIQFDGGASAMARVYIADTAHSQFVGGWSDEEKIAAILKGRGSEGRSFDYLANIVNHLRQMNIDDAHMNALLEMATARGINFR